VASIETFRGMAEPQYLMLKPSMQLDMVLRLGVSPERIVFANACKRPRDIRAAANKQVRKLPFLTLLRL